MDKKNLFIALCGMFLIFLLTWSWVKISVYGPSIEKYSKQLKEVRTRFDDMDFIKSNIASMKSTFETTNTEFDTLKSIVPNSENYVVLLKEIKSLATKNKIEIISITPRLMDSFPAVKTYLTSSNKHIERYPVQVKLFGKYLNLGNLLEEMLALPSIVNIGRLTLASELTKDGGVSCDLVLFTYMYKQRK